MYWATYKETDNSEPYWIKPTVVVDDLIYAIGGHFLNCYLIKVYVLNTHTLTWSVLDDGTDTDDEELEPLNVPVNRMGHKVVAYDKKIYLWGGINGDEQATNILFCFDTKTLKWSRPKVTGIIPSIRTGHLACISDHLMYIFGGFNVDTKQKFCDVHCLDLKTMNWSNIITTGEIPLPTHYHDATIVNNRMYIFGGYEKKNEHEVEETFLFDTVYLDLESNQWHRPEATGNIPAGDNHRSLFVHNNIIYVLRGCTDRNEIYYFDTKRNNWNLIKPRGKSPIAREEQSCNVIGDKMFFLCGNSVSPRSEIYVLDFNPSLKTLATMAIVENGLDFSCLPIKLRSEIDSMSQHLATLKLQSE